MRHSLIITLFVLSCTMSRAQSVIPDSLFVLLRNAKTDSSKVRNLYRISKAYMSGRPDSALFAAQKALFLARNGKYREGEMIALKQMADVYRMTGNYPQALRFYLERLKLDEKDPDPLYKIVTSISIANLYQQEGDYEKALIYSRNSLTIIQDNIDSASEYLWYSYSGFGDLYTKMNNLANAMFYNQKAYEIALSGKDSGQLGMSLNNLANTYAKAKKTDTALSIYYAGIPYLEYTNNGSFLCESYQGIATLLFRKGDVSNAIIYANKSLDLSEKGGFDKKYITAANLLTEIYAAEGSTDSAFKYQARMVAIKDSVYSQDKIKQLSNLTIQEELRQKELSEQQLQESRDRKYQLDMLMIGLLIPFFFLLSFLLSKRKIKVKVLEFIGILSLLLLFEYLTLLLHPWVVELTHHSPFMEIAIFVIIAGLLTPSHHRIQHWMLHKLTNPRHQHHNTPSLNPAFVPESEEVFEALQDELYKKLPNPNPKA